MMSTIVSCCFLLWVMLQQGAYFCYKHPDYPRVVRRATLAYASRYNAGLIRTSKHQVNQHNPFQKEANNEYEILTYPQFR